MNHDPAGYVIAVMLCFPGAAAPGFFTDRAAAAGPEGAADTVGHVPRRPDQRRKFIVHGSHESRTFLAIAHRRHHDGKRLVL